MVNLFQNKKILFTLILIASCFGILGVGGEIFAGWECAQMHCDTSWLGGNQCKKNDYETQPPDATKGYLFDGCLLGCPSGGACLVGSEQSGSGNSCKNNESVCQSKSNICKESGCPKTDDSWNKKPCAIAAHKDINGKKCDKVWGIWDSTDDRCIICKGAVEDKIIGGGGILDCNGSTSGDNQCELACGADSRCDEKLPDTGNCDKNCNYKSTPQITPPNTICESENNQVCCDMNISDCPDSDIIRSGATDCPGYLICCKKGSCVPKTTAICNCHYWNSYKDTDPPQCNDSGQILQIKKANPTAACGLNDCPDKTQWEMDHSKCPPKTTAPASVVPVIPKPSSIGGGVSPVVDPPPGPPPAPGGAVRFTNPLSTNSFEALVMGIINWILGIVVSLAILFLIIGGLMYIISAGDEEKIKKAKNIILYAIIGLGVVILSWSIITELKDILGVQ